MASSLKNAGKLVLLRLSGDFYRKAPQDTHGGLYEAHRLFDKKLAVIPTGWKIGGVPTVTFLRFPTGWKKTAWQLVTHEGQKNSPHRKIGAIQFKVSRCS